MNMAGMACEDELQQRQPDRVSALSNRELEIAELVGNGHTNRQIARMLCLSEKTVETHLARTFVKLGVSSRAAVASAVASANVRDDRRAR